MDSIKFQEYLSKYFPAEYELLGSKNITAMQYERLHEIYIQWLTSRNVGK